MVALRVHVSDLDRKIASLVAAIEAGVGIEEISEAPEPKTTKNRLHLDLLVATSFAWPGSAPVTRDELIARALAFLGAVEEYPFDDDLLTVKVGGKGVCLDSARRVRLARPRRTGRGQAAPETVEELRGTCRGQVDPARPLDERYWLAVPIGATIPDGEVTDLLATSYDEVVRRLPKHNRPVRGGQHGS